MFTKTEILKKKKKILIFAFNRNHGNTFRYTKTEVPKNTFIYSCRKTLAYSY